MYPDLDRSVFGKKTLSYLEADMARYIGRKGVLPILIPDLEEGLLIDLLTEMDGFVLQGGTDISPKSYGEEPIMDGKWPGDPYRDQYELKILGFAIRNGKPVFGICRGLQLMNVYFGGTLYQDTATQRNTSVSHRNALLYDTVSHRIEFTAGKILDRVYGGEHNLRVNTVHHQSIKTLGNNLEVLAVCPEDGTIEAIGYTGTEEGKVMAVQWHPEFSASQKGKLIDEQRLLTVFLDHVKKSKG